MGTGGIREISYEDTEHFTVTRDFLNRYPQMLKVLLAGEEENEVHGSSP